MTDELPLPEGIRVQSKFGDMLLFKSTGLRKGDVVYPADQMRAYGAARAAAEREKAASLRTTLEEIVQGMRTKAVNNVTIRCQTLDMFADEIAAAIRKGE
jgi:hypothetical protein